MNPMDRRTFLKGGAAAAVAVALTESGVPMPLRRAAAETSALPRHPR